MLTEQQIFDFLCKRYVTRADTRKHAMNLLYLEAEVHDLARELNKLLSSEKPTAATLRRDE